MSYNNYMYAIERDPEYLAHYGVKGMRWGVRKALESGNSRALARQYRKASKKLAKLQRQAANGSKYAKRAAALGAGAAAAGGLAAVGTSGVSKAFRASAKGLGSASTGLGAAMQGAAKSVARANIKNPKLMKAQLAATQALAGGGKALSGAGHTLNTAGVKGSNAISRWGKQTGLALENSKSQQYHNAARAWKEQAERTAAGDMARYEKIAKSTKYSNKANAARTQISNNTLARAGAAAVGAGLLAGAGYNAYRAATTKKAAQRAADFQKEMNKAFKGTQYANGGSGNRSSSNKSRKRRRRG